MNIISKLTLRYMKQNKRRTLITIFGAIVSVAMLTAVFTIAASFIDMMKRHEINSKGLWQAVFTCESADNYDYIKSRDDVENADLIYESGFAQVDELSESLRPYLFVENHSDFSIAPINLTSGDFPKNSDEIILSETFLKALGNKWKIGDTITLDLGERIVNYQDEDGNEFEKTAGKYTSYSSKDNKFNSTGTKTYKIVGVCDTRSYPSSYAAFSTITSSEIPADTEYDVNVNFKNYESLRKGIYDHMKEISKETNSKYEPNNMLLVYSGIARSENILKMIYSIVIILGIIIMIASISLIYNSFAISLAERSRSLGMIASVGATKQQKRSSVYFEAFIIALVSIPIGILFGTLGIGLVFKIVNSMLTDIPGTGMEFELVVVPISIVGTILFSFLTLLLSASKPARRVSKISPISAIRQNEDIKIAKKDVKTPRIYKKLFGFEGELAVKNLKRNKRRYRVTVFSLALSMSLFVIVSSFTSYMKTAYTMQDEYPEENLILSVHNYDNSTRQTFDKMKDFLNVDDVQSKAITMSATLYAESQNLPLSKDLTDNSVLEYNFVIYGLDEDSFNEYAKKTNTTFNENDDIPNVIVWNTFVYATSNSRNQITQLNAKTGDVLELNSMSQYYEPEGQNKFTSKVKIAGLTDTPAPGLSKIKLDTTTIALIVPEKTFDEIYTSKQPEDFNLSVSAAFKTENTDKLEENLTPLIDKYSDLGLYVFNIDQAVQSQNQMNLIVSIFFYGFAGLITIICLSNTVNTISTNNALRKREFAMLKSYGITPKSLNKMLNLEGFFYGFKATICSLPFSIILTYLLHQSMVETFAFPYKIPIIKILIASAVVFLTTGLTMLSAKRKTNKTPIVEALRDENT